MRFLRTFFAAAGASGAIIAAGGIILVILSASLAFEGWPGVRLPGSDAGTRGATELAAVPDRAARHPVARGELTRVAAVTTLPAVPVSRSSRPRSGQAEHRRRQRR